MPSLRLVAISVFAWVMAVFYYAHTAWPENSGDIASYWTAGQLLARGDLATLYDPDAFNLAARVTRGIVKQDVFHLWPYPPFALFFVAPLGLTPYAVGFALWSVAGIVALAFAARRFFETRAEALLLLTSPAVVINLLLSQNGAFIAALLLAMAATTRPISAGFILGLLSIKPHLGAVMAVATLARRQWRVLGIAMLTVAGLVLATLSVFGVDAWRGFLAQGTAHARLFAEAEGRFQLMAPGIFVAARLSGLSFAPALAIQALVAAGALVVVWRTASGGRRAAALVFVATLLVSPYSFAYDMIPVAVAALVLHGEARTVLGRLLSVLLWLAPVGILATNAMHVPVIPVLLVAALVKLARDPESTRSRAQ